MTSAPDYSTSYCSSTFVVKIAGPLSVEGCLNIIDTHYPTISATNILWDMLGAEFDSMDIEAFKTLAQRSSLRFPDQRFRRIAFVTNNATLHHLACVYTAVAAMKTETLERSVFRSVREAEAWFATPH